MLERAKKAAEEVELIRDRLLQREKHLEEIQSRLESLLNLAESRLVAVEATTLKCTCRPFSVNVGVVVW